MVRPGDEKRLKRLGEGTVEERRVDNIDVEEEEGTDKANDDDEEEVGEVGIVVAVVLEISEEGRFTSIPNPAPNPDSGFVPIPPIPLVPPIPPVILLLL